MSIEKVRLTEQDRMPWPEQDQDAPSWEVLFRECQPEHVYRRRRPGTGRLPNADEQAGAVGSYS